MKCSNPKSQGALGARLRVRVTRKGLPKEDAFAVRALKDWREHARGWGRGYGDGLGHSKQSRGLAAQVREQHQWSGELPRVGLGPNPEGLHTMLRRRDFIPQQQRMSGDSGTGGATRSNLY